MKITELVARKFDRAVQARGRGYFYDKVVDIDYGNEWAIRGDVDGSELYEVALSLDVDKKILRGFCDCPHGEPCKHLWAALLQCEKQNYLSAASSLDKLDFILDFNLL